MKQLKIKLDALEQEILKKALENIKNAWIDEIKEVESKGAFPLFTKEFVEDLLNSKGKKKCLFKAKPEGLYLQEVYYEEND